MLTPQKRVDSLEAKDPDRSPKKARLSTDPQQEATVGPQATEAPSTNHIDELQDTQLLSVLQQLGFPFRFVAMQGMY
jgi:hypothetical protein